MTQGARLIAEILLSVARGERTVAQLKRQLADGLAYVEARGVKHVERELLTALAAMESAIARIEAERARARPAEKQLRSDTMTDGNNNFAQACQVLAESLINVTEHPQCPDYLAEILNDAALSIANEIADDARVEDSIRRIFARLAERRGDQ